MPVHVQMLIFQPAAPNSTGSANVATTKPHATIVTTPARIDAFPLTLKYSRF